ncbi:type VII secretion target [Mycolicibacterium obuense]|uniref:type VII secretion target n=1 Tax=Mycolicibacterium obuense TaxID=1807 RepID=UPI0009E291D3
MGALSVDTEELARVAKEAESLARGLRFSTSTPAGPITWQPTSAALAAIESSLQVASTRLAARMRSTADSLSKSSSAYVEQDDRAGTAISTFQI